MAETSTLTDLNISCNNIPGIGKAFGEAHRANSSLKTLILNGNNMKGTGGSFGHALKCNSSLEDLSMRFCSLQPADGKQLAAGLAITTSLKRLDFRNNDYGRKVEAMITKVLDDKLASGYNKFEFVKFE